MNPHPAANDPFDLARFVTAQQGMYENALAELRAARKRTHWMWFIFPQIDGLGLSSTTKHYAIKSLQEAQAYLDHPILGPRLRSCAQAVLGVDGHSAHDILGSPDDFKLQSSMTLFSAMTDDSGVFVQVLTKLYGGQRDQKSIALMAKLPG
jgi:uncharacterized protein (DUF1810 family)